MTYLRETENPGSWGEAFDIFMERCDNKALSILNYLMNEAEEKTGSRPEWNDPLPLDILLMFHVAGPEDDLSYHPWFM